MSEHRDTTLWRAVIGQALEDATRPLSKIRHHRLDQLRAREWLTQPNRDFEQVCALADWDAERVRNYARPLIERATQATTPGVGLSPARNAKDRPPRVAEECA
jgi:hypothetical protein